MTFPKGIEPGLYKRKELFIDADGNRRCDVGEPHFSDSSFALADKTIVVTPGDSPGHLEPARAEECDIRSKP